MNLFFIDIEELSCGEDFVLAYEAIFFPRNCFKKWNWEIIVRKTGEDGLDRVCWDEGRWLQFIMELLERFG